MREPVNNRPRQTALFWESNRDFKLPTKKSSPLSKTEDLRAETINVMHNSVIAKFTSEIGRFSFENSSDGIWLDSLLKFRRELLNDLKYTPGAADSLLSQNLDKITKTDVEKLAFEDVIKSLSNKLTLEIPWGRVYEVVGTRNAEPETPEQELAELEWPDFSDFVYLNWFTNKVMELWDHDGLKYPIAELIKKFPHDFDKQRLEEHYRSMSGKSTKDKDPEMMDLNRFLFYVIQEKIWRDKAEAVRVRLTGGATPNVDAADRNLFDDAIQASPKFSYIRQRLIGDPEFDASIFSGDSSANKPEKWSLKGGLLYLGARPCVGKNTELKKRLFTKHHKHINLPHISVDEVWRDLSTKYFWPVIKKDVEKLCDQCDKCHPKLVPASQWHREAQFPFERVTLNLIKGFKPSVGYRDGSESVMVVIDVVSHYGLFLALDSRKGLSTFQDHFKQYVIERHAIPATVVPRGREMNDLASNLAKTMQIVPLGLEAGDKYDIMHAKVEQLIERNVRKNYDGWIFDLAMVMNNYNNTRVAELGTTPNEIIMGESGHPVDLDQFKSEFQHHTFISNPFK